MIKTKYFISLAMSTFILSGCSLLNDNALIQKNDIEKNLKEKENYSTPMDNIYHINLTCFENVEDNDFKGSHQIKASQLIGSDISINSSFDIVNDENSKKEIKNRNDSFGDSLNFSLTEDINGEYYASIDYSKKE